MGTLDGLPLPFKLKSCEHLHTGENENFLLETSDGSFFILKRYRQDRKQRLGIEAEVELAQFLNRNNFPTSQYVCFEGGEKVHYLNQNGHTLQKLIYGSQAFSTLPNDFLEIGVIYKNLHALKLPQELLEQMPQITVDTALLDHWHHLENSKDIAPSTLDKIRSVRDRVVRELRFESPLFIHFDLHEGNMISTPTGTHIIDWEESGLGPAILDLAVTGTRLLRRDDYEDCLKEMIEGYGGVDKDQLDLAIAFKLLYLASFVAKFTDLSVPEGKAALYERYLGYMERLGLNS